MVVITKILFTSRLLRQEYVYQKHCSTYKTVVHCYPWTLQKYVRYALPIYCITQPDTRSYHSWFGTFMHNSL